ncbi:MAG: extracellular solute-binding protein [Aggregatilineales bacterium]
MKRNRFLVITILFAMLTLIVGIAPSMAQEESLLVWAPPENSAAVTELGALFEEEYGITIEVQEVPFDQIADDLVNFGPVGEGPDIIITENSRLGQLVANGALLPLDLSDISDLFNPSALNIFTYQGETWALPFAWENVALIRNTDLVPEAPATWQEVRAISEELQSSGTAQYGFVPLFGDPYHQFPIITAFGGYIFGVTEDGSYDVNDIGLGSEGGLAGAEFISGLYQDGLADPDMDNDVVLELFAQGELAMFITGPWFSQRVIDAGVPYSVDPIPGADGALENGRPFSGGFGFAISAFSDKALLAEIFIYDFLSTQEAQEVMITAEEGTVLTRFPAFNGVDISEDPNIQGFIDAGASAMPMPQIPEMGSVWAAWGNATRLIGQGEDPTESYSNAVVQIEQAITDAQAEDSE